MLKTIIKILVGLGIIFLLLSAFIESVGTLILAIIFLGVGLYLGLRPGGILRKEQVIDSWGVLIEDGQSKADEVFQDTENLIRETKAPAIGMKIKKMAPGIIKGALGVQRDFLVVINQERIRLDPYQIFINARDYGNNLDISWYLTYRPSFFMAILSLIPFVKIIPLSLSDLDLFDQQDLTAYTTNCHHCLLKAVEKQMLALNQDFSKIEKKSRGFLGIS
ncbi:hypothetical protein C4E24_01035 [ANME-1 cluster archaeon AG-394-G21]|nr:hypothetical protein [ANME-1 cluster archaeon AG-394-G21]